MKINFTIGRRIGFGFGVLIFLTLLSFVFTNKTLNKSKELNDKIVQNYSPSLRALQNLYIILIRSKMLINNWVYNPSPLENPEKQNLITLINHKYPHQKKIILELSKQWDKSEQKKIESVFKDMDELYAMHRMIMSKLNSIENYNDPNILFIIRPMVDEQGEVSTKTNDIAFQLENMIILQENNVKKASSQMIKSFNLLQVIVKSLAISLVIGGILIAFFTTLSIVKPVQELKIILLNMAKGIWPKEHIKNRNDEIGEMTNALNLFVDALKQTTEFSKQIGAGNFDFPYEPLSEEDTLGKALLKMRDELWESKNFLEEKVRQRTEQIEKQKDELEQQRKKLEVLYSQLTASIRYAKRIQDAILPPMKYIKNSLKEFFILFKPRDIVSGDFYWFAKQNNKIFFAVVDCTGHGVPGAFMSIVGYNILNKSIKEIKNATPGKILHALDKGVTETLHQSSDPSSTNDGMDIAMCALNTETNELEFAGAYNPLYLIRKGELILVKADRCPIGGFYENIEKKFNTHVIQVQKGDIIYLSSDGFADQFGGPKKRKFMHKRFRNTLLEVSKLDIDKQEAKLNEYFENWKGDLEQVDDICILGVKII